MLVIIPLRWFAGGLFSRQCTLNPHCRENKAVGRTSVRRSRLRLAPRRTEARPTKSAYFRDSALNPGL